jgi:hypothetical protein
VWRITESAKLAAIIDPSPACTTPKNENVAVAAKHLAKEASRGKAGKSQQLVRNVRQLGPKSTQADTRRLIYKLKPGRDGDRYGRSFRSLHHYCLIS